jgi:transcriptional regulator with XRE-family HTH domain
MRSAVYDILPPRVSRSLTKFGSDLALARRKRNLTTAMMSERLGIAKSTYVRLEKGDPSVSMGAYAMALFALGFGAAFAELIDTSRDEQGLLLDAQRVPKRGAHASGADRVMRRFAMRRSIKVFLGAEPRLVGVTVARSGQ